MAVIRILNLSMLGSILLSCFVLLHCGCAKKQIRPMITAVGLSPGNQCESPGIPYYLPKPLLVVAKNFRHIDESKVGLTGAVPIPGAFDNQAAYADVKANVTVPGTTATPTTGGDTTFNVAGQASIPESSIVAETMTPSARVGDDIAPDSFFTYQVMFVPDLTQKYGLQISGGAGEFRAAMNMVNGWMYTGMGPFYMKDSSSAQNAMATGIGALYAGRGASDVLNEVGELTTAIGELPGPNESTDFQQLSDLAAAMREVSAAAEAAPLVPDKMLNYAEIYIYEPVLTPDGSSTEWRMVAEHHFVRDYFRYGYDPTAMLQHRQSVIEAMIKGVSSGNAEGSAQQIESLQQEIKGLKEKIPPTASDENASESGEFPNGGDSNQILEQFQGTGTIAPKPNLKLSNLSDVSNSPGNKLNQGTSLDSQGVVLTSGTGGSVQPIQINVGTKEPKTTKVKGGSAFLRRLLHKPRPSIQNKVQTTSQTAITKG